MTATYFVRVDQGKFGHEWIARDANATDKRTLITDLISMQIEDPIQIIEVDIADGTSRDVTEDVARELADWSATKCEPLHHKVIAFVEQHIGTRAANELEAA